MPGQAFTVQNFYWGTVGTIHPIFAAASPAISPQGAPVSQHIIARVIPSEKPKYLMTDIATPVSIGLSP